MTLEEEYAALDRLERQRRDLAATFQIEGDVEGLVERISELQTALPAMADWIVEIHTKMLRSESAAQTIRQVAEVDNALRTLETELDEISERNDDQPLDELLGELQNAADALDDLPAFLQCLEEAAAMPERLAASLRRLPLTPLQIEAATVDRTWQDALRAERDLGRFSGTTRQRHVHRLEQLYEQWLKTNAVDIRWRSQHRFLANIARLLRRLEGCEENVEADEETLRADEESDGEDEWGDVAPDCESSPATNKVQVEAEITVSRPDPASTLADRGEGTSTPSAESVCPGEGATRHFEHTSDHSNKFWEITLSGNGHTVRFGRIGTNGQTRTKQFGTPAQAQDDCERLIRSKLAKGYQET